LVGKIRAETGIVLQDFLIMATGIRHDAVFFGHIRQGIKEREETYTNDNSKKDPTNLIKTILISEKSFIHGISLFHSSNSFQTYHKSINTFQINSGSLTYI
jgi:hypothetical protein